MLSASRNLPRRLSLYYIKPRTVFTSPGFLSTRRPLTPVAEKEKTYRMAKEADHHPDFTTHSPPGFSDSEPPGKRQKLDSGDVVMDTEQEFPVDSVDSDGLSATVTGGHTKKSAAPSKKQTANQRRKLEKARRKPIEPGTAEDVNWLEVVELLGREAVDEAIAQKREWDQVYTMREEVEVVVEALSSSGM
jgi:hypothetical protein